MLFGCLFVYLYAIVRRSVGGFEDWRMGYVPGCSWRMGDLPDTIVDLPDIMVDLPDTMVDLPDTMAVLPDTMVDLPDTVKWS